jgi:hypothetical protein
MTDLDAQRTAEHDRIEKRDHAYAVALQEADQRQKQAVEAEQAVAEQAVTEQAPERQQPKGKNKT